MSRLTVYVVLALQQVGEQSVGDGGMLEPLDSMAEEEEDRQSISTPPLFAGVATAA